MMFRKRISIQLITLSLILTCASSELLGNDSGYALVPAELMFYEHEGWVNYVSCCEVGSSNHQIRGIRVDSIAERPGETIYYFNREIFYPYSGQGNCFTTESSIIGDSIIENSDGISWCYNMQGEEISINRFLGVGASHVSYTNEDGSYITSTVHLLEFKSFLGVSDTVKTYGFQYFDPDGVQQDHKVNQYEIELSRNYGIIKNCNFRDFPDYLNEVPAMHLVSNSDLHPDKFLIKKGDIFDFNIGDEFHYYTESVPQYTRTQRRVIHKQASVFKDTITYTFLDRVKGYREYYDSNGNQATEVIDKETTVTTRYVDMNSYFPSPGLLPMEADVTTERPSNFLLYKHENIYNGRLVISDPCLILYPLGECTTLGSYLNLIPREKYIIGLGKYQTLYNPQPYPYCRQCETLQYYKKGDEEWGTPYALSADPRQTHVFEVYPNPASSIVTVKADTEIDQLLVYNSMGTLVFVQSSTGASSTEINLSDLEPGIYSLQVKTSGGRVDVRKIILI